jgi:tetratricopeptide (TPR) repeat protein
LSLPDVTCTIGDTLELKGILTMATMHTEERIGEAWRLHRNGDNVSAEKIFREILDKAPKHLDALYGLGLARRAGGDASGAIEAFQSALQLAKDAFNAVDTTSVIDGNRGNNDLNTYEDDRFLMLQRMIQQRLDELNA